MEDNTNDLLKRLAEQSIGTCLAKLSGVSAGAWSLAAASVRKETLQAALKRHPFRSGEAAAVHFSVSGDYPFLSVMLFEPEELECVSKCFLGYAFPGIPGIKLPEEVMLLELGNIVLNSVISAVSNGLKKLLMPAVPKFSQGDALGLALELGALPGQSPAYRVIELSLDIKGGESVSRSTVLCLLPEDLAAELERRAL